MTPSVIEAAAWAVLGSLVAAGVLVAGGHGWQVAVLLPVGALGVIVLLVLASRTAVRAEPTPELPPVQVEPDSDLPLIRAELPGDHPAMWIHHGPDSESAASRVRGRRRLR